MFIQNIYLSKNKFKMTLKHLLLSLVFATLIFSCGKDDESTDVCDGVSCPAGFVATVNGSTCTCEPDGTIDPCAGVNCPEGFTATANGTNCDCVDSGGTTITQVNVTGIIGTTTWTKDNIYIINGKAVVDDGQTLTIEAGTVIKGSAGSGSLASALIVARGGKLNAVGTATAPIIFTSVQDEIVSGQIISPNLNESNNALWGGLIILGKAPTSAVTGDTEAQIEGIPADDLFGRYGGTDPADNSGTIKYISVRHGGASIGADNEINGITFGGVGNGTIVENIEVVANLDDGVEFFGGTVNVKNVVVAFGEDDGLDIDQNYAGTITNAIVIQSGATAGDNALEIDGPEGTTYTNGLFTINNITLIDKDGAADTGGDLKAKAQGTINNASWRGYTDNVKIRASFQNNCTENKSDSYTNYIGQTLKITNSEWVGSAAIADWTTVYTESLDNNQAACSVPASYEPAIDALISANGNSISATATKGADASAFDDWSWVAANNEL
jgi:hypothetical protein